MTRLRIKLPAVPARSYPIHFCATPHEIVRRIANITAGSTAFVVTDHTVRRIHGNTFERLLSGAGVSCRTIVLAPGERSKSRRCKERLEDEMIRSGAERGSVVVAFGGGVVGDVAGFAAATLFRGVRLIQVPTTLLAQVDSAVGGKVGIDHPSGKNLLGSFHHPEAVLVHPGYLGTLPSAEYVGGMAEVIKCALILDRRLFNRLRASASALLSRRSATLTPVIARCCALKGAVVAADERETGYRRILNFGHTIGHAIEQASRYRVGHGSAVSIGIAAESRLSLALGMITPAELAGVLGMLGRFGLPVAPPRTLSRPAILRALRFDKKKSGGAVRFTLLEAIGSAVTGVEIPPALLDEVITR